MRIDIHHYVHLEGADEVLKELKNIKLKLNTMATKAEFQQALTEVTSALENISADITRLTDQLAQGGLSDADEQEVFTQLRAVADRAKQIADATPEPAEPGTPEPTPEA